MTKNRIVILMLGGARRVSLAELLKKSGAALDHEVEILSYELSPEVPIAAVGEVIEGLKWNDPEVVGHIVKICRDRKVDIILPFVDGAIEIAARCSGQLPGVFIPNIDAETASCLFDKVRAAEAFAQAGIPIPATYSALTAEMPAIAKPRHGSASRGIKVFHNMGDLMHLPHLDDYLVQEYIGKREEYTVDCYVARDGKLMCAVPRQRLEVMGGEVTRTVTRRIPELQRMSGRIIEAFGLRGPVTLQFLRDLQRDRFLLMEVSPRLGGGVACSIHAGAPITDYIVREWLGVPLSACEDWADDTLMARYWKEVIFHDSRLCH